VKQLRLFERWNPTPPSLREVTRLVREANRYWDGGEFCALYLDRGGTVRLLPAGSGCPRRAWFEFVREWLPGDGKRCDAVGIARRLIAAVKDRAC
jgi:hypothetical protein